MKEGATYPEYIGVSEVATRSAEQMRVEAFFEGQPSIMFDEPEGFDIGDPPDLRGRSPGWTPVHAQLARETHRSCPQLGLFRLAKIPMVVSWFREGRARPLFEERFQMGSAGAPAERLIEVAKKQAKRK